MRNYKLGFKLIPSLGPGQVIELLCASVSLVGTSWLSFYQPELLAQEHK